MWVEFSDRLIRFTHNCHPLYFSLKAWIWLLIGSQVQMENNKPLEHMPYSSHQIFTASMLFTLLLHWDCNNFSFFNVVDYKQICFLWLCLHLYNTYRIWRKVKYLINKSVIYSVQNSNISLNFSPFSLLQNDSIFPEMIALPHVLTLCRHHSSQH